MYQQRARTQQRVKNMIVLRISAGYHNYSFYLIFKKLSLFIFTTIVKMSQFTLSKFTTIGNSQCHTIATPLAGVGR